MIEDRKENINQNQIRNQVIEENPWSSIFKELKDGKHKPQIFYPNLAAGITTTDEEL